ncbi:MAG: universal stress protein [Candidatus Nitrosopolaris sp.]
MVAIDGSDHSIKEAEYSLNIAKAYCVTLHTVTGTYLPESYHMKLENALDKSKIGESIDAKSWFETFEQTAKVNNIPLKAELIHSHS